jgi:polyribonucleotide nucleotidyltransferase
LEIAHDAIRVQINAQKEIWEMTGSKAKREYKKPEHNEELRAKVNSFASRKYMRLLKPH